MTNFYYTYFSYNKKEFIFYHKVFNFMYFYLKRKKLP